MEKIVDKMLAVRNKRSGISKGVRLIVNRLSFMALRIQAPTMITVIP